MANVITHPQLQVGFHPGPVGHSPSPLGFGFGLSSNPMMQGWPSSTSSPAQPPSWGFAAQPSHATSRVAKRRHEPEEEDRDETMDRSPTPERPKRTAPKRARTTPAVPSAGKEPQTAKENKPPSGNDASDVDVGFLLASLPPQSLLPLVTSLLSTQPTLKPTILSLIPRPSLDTALQALANSAQKLKDAYPYSNSLFSQSSSSLWSSSAGPGTRPGTSLSTGFGFGARPVGGSAFSNPPVGGMRDEYIVSRLRPHIQEFVSACFSYLPYFSYSSNIASTEPIPSSKVQITTQTHAAALRQQHKDKLHPTETYLFLVALTSHMLSQPPLSLASLAPMLTPRLSEEWKAWVDHVDTFVNRQGGMFGHDAVATWMRGLDEFAQAKDNGMEMMKEVRDLWVSKVGWLVGRQPIEAL